MATRAQSLTHRSPRSRPLVLLACAVGLFALSGASCPQVVRQYKLPAVRAQARAITLDELAMRVNENSARVRSLSSTSATLSGEKFPSLRASIAIERPRRFRLVAEKTGLSGTELDLGSNDELFWFWVKRSEPPALYFCRHEQFAYSAARQVFPVEPEWLVEAMGLAEIDPAQVTYGPAPVGDSRLRVELTVSRPEGQRRKVIVFDEPGGYIVEQHVYDERGALIATALMGEHERDPATGAVLPRQIEVQWPSTNFSMKIRLRDLVVNQLAGDPAQLWTKPGYAGWPDIDLADPRNQLPAQPVAQPVVRAPLQTSDRRNGLSFWRRR